jgi:hypothetical protein
LTLRTRVQLEPALRVRPDIDIELGVKEGATPQVLVVSVTTNRPAGTASVMPTPVSATVAFGLESVKVNEVVPPTATVAAPNTLEMVGGATTVIDAVAAG